MFVCYFIVDDFIMTLIFALTRFSIKNILLFLFPYTFEVYSTTLRGIGLGFGNGIGGFVSCFLPFAIFPLFYFNRYYIFLFLGGLGFIGFLSSIQLSIDTTNKSLDQVENQPTKNSKTEYLVDDKTRCIWRRRNIKFKIMPFLNRMIE